MLIFMSMISLKRIIKEIMEAEMPPPAHIQSVPATNQVGVTVNVPNFSTHQTNQQNVVNTNVLATNDLNTIVSAIYQLEGGAKTKFPYGIKSIDTKGDVKYAKRICENTVRNNYQRWIKAGKKGKFFDYLADVYCPPKADKQGNINWKKNIRQLTKLDL